jgi:hypothetical protein
MRRHRTIYFNDARHYYLFVFEPPMTLEDAWRPVDEAASTAVDTFSYGVERGDGLFYPSRVGMRFGEDIQPFEQAAYWRVWNNMQSLIDRDLDPLTVLIDRAHDKGMDFFASLRLGSYGNIDPSLSVRTGGRGYINREVRDHVFAVLKELATEYATEGVELDFAAPPGGSPFYFQDEDVAEGTLVMTQWLREVTEMVRGRPSGAGQVGARVYPTEEINLSKGLDVRTWLKEQLVDFVVPMVYADFAINSDMPIGWLIQAAHEADISVYPMVQPYYHREDRRFHTVEHATPSMMRAAVASNWEMGADGMYAWFLLWPLGDAQRRILTELGDPDLVKEGDKHYVVARSSRSSDELGLETPLPIEMPSSDTGTRHRVPFQIADDVEGAAWRIRQVRLNVNIKDLVSADHINMYLNGRSLADETCLRRTAGPVAPYSGQWLEFQLSDVRPRKGRNVLEIVLVKRADGLVSPLVIEDVEIIVEYGPYPSALETAHTSR